MTGVGVASIVGVMAGDTVGLSDGVIVTVAEGDVPEEGVGVVDTAGVVEAPGDGETPGDGDTTGEGDGVGVAAADDASIPLNTMIAMIANIDSLNITLLNLKFNHLKYS